MLQTLFRPVDDEHLLLPPAPIEEGDHLLPLPRPPTTKAGGELFTINFAPPFCAIISLIVDAAPGNGGIAWPAGMVLSRYIAQKEGKWDGKTILDLGSGTGLVGIVAGKAHPGAQVYLTDLKEMVPLLERNVALNFGEQERIHVLEYNWADAQPAPLDKLKADVILVADCVYFEPAFPLLVDTLDRLCDRERTEILFAYKKRRKADKRFFTFLRKKSFTWAHVEDDPDRGTYNRDGIQLFRFHKRGGDVVKGDIE